jgi:integrase
MARRTAGEGTVYRVRPEYWLAQIRLGGGARGKTAEAARAALATKVAARQAAAMAVDETTLAGWLTHWIKHLRDMRLVKPQTWLIYESRTTQYLIPALGHLRLADLTRRDVSDMLADAANGRITGRKLAPRTVLHFRNLLSGAMEAAMDEDLVDRNVAHGVRTPRIVEREPVILSTEQAVALMAQAANMSGRAAGRGLAAIILSVSTGIRLGELLGLRRADVDLAAANLTVRTTQQFDYDRSIVLGDPKGRRSRRTVPLPTAAVAALQRHLDAQDPPNVLVFPNERGGHWLPSDFHKYVWGPLRKAAGLGDMHWHDLRHSANTILRAQGVDSVTRARMLGHSGIVNDEVYGHTSDPMMRAAAEAMGAALAG